MKKHIRELLVERRVEEIVDLAAEKKRVLGILVSLTYDPDPELAWRAVTTMGAAADRVADFNSDFVRSHLRRLFWLLNEESGGVCWYAPQAIAEIIRRRPRVWADQFPLLVTLITSMAEEDLELFRPAVLWALGRVAPVAGAEIETVLPDIAACLDDKDPRSRGMAVWCLIQAGRRDLFSERTDLLSDNEPFSLFENDLLEQTTVAALVKTKEPPE